jgi:hypothetical protein
MAKKGGKSKGFISQGMHSNLSASIKNSMRADYIASGDRIMNQRKAFDAGKNVMVTVANPNVNETNKRFIRVNAKTIWKS